MPAQSEVAGQVQQRANVPTWSTLTFTDGGQDFSPDAAQVTGWRQQLNLHDGSITTTARWTAPNGHLTDLRYVVFTDRARPNLAIVRLELTPRWTGTATVTDLIDGTPATATTLVAKGWNTADHQQWETVRTQGLGVVAGLASRVRVSPDVPSVTDTPVGNGADQTVGQRLTFPVTGNRTVTLTKYVGVSTSPQATQPESAARQHSTAAAAVGFDDLLAENTTAWASLWAGRVEVLGNPTLLAQHPDLAASMNDYRYQRLDAAKAHARETGFSGARFPWESAADGTEQIPPPTSVGDTAPRSWSTIADGLSPLDNPNSGIHSEFAGYLGQLVKQADVTMLQYPWQYPMPAATAQHDIDYYVPRSDPDGPSMDDAINTIGTAALGSPGCSSSVYTQRSITPFMRDVFDQFSETRTGGAFTFMTGIGGFLQEFLYGYSGLHWNNDAVQLDPSLTGQLDGVVLHDLAWHGRRFTVAIGTDTTRVSVDSGGPLPITVGGSTHTVTPGHPLIVPTRRPDRTPTDDLARCQTAQASSAAPGADPLAAVDGSPATDWQPRQTTASLSVPLTQEATINRATLDWGQQWPPAPAPNVPPPPGPVQTLRATDYDLVASLDGQNWTVVTQVHSRTTGTRDELSFAPVQARFVGLRITAATNQTPPILTALTVPNS